MNKTEFYNYIIENFTLSGEYARLLNNILEYAAYQGFNSDELYLFLTAILDGTIGLSDKEIRMADF